MRFAPETLRAILIKNGQIGVVHQHKVLETVAIQVANQQLLAWAGDFTRAEPRLGFSR
jgi:hypothetical protein